MNMSINQVQNYFNATRIEQPRVLSREERLKNNYKEIAKLENEITLRQAVIKDTENLISSNNKIMETADKLLGLHNGQRGLMVEARDLAIEARDAAIKVVSANNKVISANNKVISANNKLLDIAKGSRDLTQKMIGVMENMESIMMKNPAKYGGLPSSEIQKLPEVIEVKSQVTQLANGIVEQYPKEERVALTETMKNVIDATFMEIKPADMKANMKVFNNLGKRIEAALDKKHETLVTKDKDIRKIMNAHYYRPLESFYKISRLAYLDLAMKDIKA